VVQLSRWYWSYDDYKNDPDNIAVHHRTRVAELMRAAPVGRKFRDRQSMVREVFAIGFPGYGRASFAEQPRPDGAAVSGLSIEIPYAGEDRCFVFQKTAAGYELLDDLTAPNEPGILGVRKDGEELVFSAYGGQELFRRPLRIAPDRAPEPGRPTTP
jgi:hypothetical protein